MNARSFQVVAFTVCLGSLAQYVGAATVGYWQLQDLAPNSPVGTVASTVNNGALQGLANLGTPTFNASVPGTNFGGIFAVTDGLGGPIVNSNNTASVAIASGDRIQIPQSALTESASMTIEFFMKTTQSGAFAGVVVLPSTTLSGSGGNIAWGLGTEGGTNTAFYRVDVPGAVNATGAGGAAVNDNQWHHLALTFDGTNNATRLYRDYQLVSGPAGLPGGLTYDGVNGIRFGTSSTDFQNYIGLVDEIRYSNSVLSSNEFLRAIPEPASGMLMVFGAGALFRFRRRK